MTQRELDKKADAESGLGERLLKIAQVARVWNVSERTVWRDIQAGKVKVIYAMPGRPRVPVSALATRPRAAALPAELVRCGVYFVEGPALVKIGKAHDANQRFVGLRNESPVPLRFMGWIATEDDAAARRLEGQLHERFGQVRAHGEWFALTEAQVLGVLAEFGGVIGQPIVRHRATTSRAEGRNWSHSGAF